MKLQGGLGFEPAAVGGPLVVALVAHPSSQSPKGWSKELYAISIGIILAAWCLEKLETNLNQVTIL